MWWIYWSKLEKRFICLRNKEKRCVLLNELEANQRHKNRTKLRWNNKIKNIKITWTNLWKNHLLLLLQCLCYVLIFLYIYIYNHICIIPNKLWREWCSIFPINRALKIITSLVCSLACLHRSFCYLTKFCNAEQRLCLCLY